MNSILNNLFSQASQLSQQIGEDPDVAVTATAGLGAVAVGAIAVLGYQFYSWCRSPAVEYAPKDHELDDAISRLDPLIKRLNPSNELLHSNGVHRPAPSPDDEKQPQPRSPSTSPALNGHSHSNGLRRATSDSVPRHGAGPSAHDPKLPTNLMPLRDRVAVPESRDRATSPLNGPSLSSSENAVDEQTNQLRIKHLEWLYEVSQEENQLLTSRLAALSSHIEALLSSSPAPVDSPPAASSSGDGSKDSGVFFQSSSSSNPDPLTDPNRASGVISPSRVNDETHDSGIVALLNKNSASIRETFNRLNLLDDEPVSSNPSQQGSVAASSSASGDRERAIHAALLRTSLIEAERDRLRKQLKASESQRDLLRDRLAEKTELTSIAADYPDRDPLADEAQRENEKLLREMSSLEERLKELEGNLVDQNSEVRKAVVAEYEKKIQDLSLKIETLETELHSAKENTSINEELARQLEQVQQELAALKAAPANQTKRRPSPPNFDFQKKLQTELNSLQDANTQLQEAYAGAQQELSKLATTLQREKEQYSKLESAKNKLSEEITRLEEAEQNAKVALETALKEKEDLAKSKSDLQSQVRDNELSLNRLRSEFGTRVQEVRDNHKARLVEIFGFDPNLAYHNMMSQIEEAIQTLNKQMTDKDAIIATMEERIRASAQQNR